MATKVLVVDDEKMIVKGIRFSLLQDGYEVDTAYDGDEALQKATDNKYDIILLDVMLPKHSGLEVLQQIREFSSVPVIMLTAKGEDMDKILGLDYGADDYITKPFNILEVKARIKAIIRRVAGSRKEKSEEEERILENGDLRMDFDNRRVSVAGKGCENSGCSHQKTSRKGGAQRIRACLCTDQVGRRLLLQTK